MKKPINRRKFLGKALKSSLFFGLGKYRAVFFHTSGTREFDLLITGGLVYNGLGDPPFESDIAINGERITRIQTGINPGKARQVIEASGIAVCPGFIDAHSHTDVSLLVNPRAESQVRQGVTTEISGNCGFSPFPISDSVFDEYLSLYQDEYHIKLDWKDINGFFRRVGEQRMAINYATLLGHGNLRGKVVGYYDRPPTENEMTKMKALIRKNMKSGALGLSSGLEYAPGSYARPSELIGLCHEVARLKGIYATHMRDEGDDILNALEEATQIARITGVSLQISHLKVAYQKNWSKINAVLRKIETAAKQGVHILADRYPYIAGSTGLDYFFPLWSKQGTTREFIARLKDPGLEKKFRNHLKNQERRLGSWNRVLISSVFTEKNKNLEGKSILEASRETGQDPFSFIKNLLIQEVNRVSMILFLASEDNLKRILEHSLVVIGSDGVAVAPYGLLSKGKPHPRYYGTFARILSEYCRREKIFSLEKAIQKMTSLTAQKFGLQGRGRIERNCYADLVIFNPDKVSDTATWGNPQRYPRGIETVIVNGQIVVRENTHTGKLPGKILKKSLPD